jgi:hypothetical protein
LRISERSSAELRRRCVRGEFGWQAAEQQAVDDAVLERGQSSTRMRAGTPTQIATKAPW